MAMITFDDPAALNALPLQARFTFANQYSEAGMTVSEGVSPPRSFISYGHYHLAYEQDGILPARLQGASGDASRDSRFLFSHAGDQIISLTHDPDRDGVPDPFDLSSIDVLDGEVSVGIQLASGGSILFRELDGPAHWTFGGATNVISATLSLEGVPQPGPNFMVDNISFEVVTPTPSDEDHGRPGPCGRAEEDVGSAADEPFIFRIFSASREPLTPPPGVQDAVALHPTLTNLQDEILLTWGIEPPGSPHRVNDGSLIA